MKIHSDYSISSWISSGISKFAVVLSSAAAFLALMTLLFASGTAVAQEGDAMVEPTETVEVAQADTTPPADVENVKATPGDGEILLTWNIGSDDTGIQGYYLYYGDDPVTEDFAEYANGPIDVGNKITYTVADLTNGEDYFFAVTAYDAAGNESANYSVEVGATPGVVMEDEEAPTVVSAAAEDNETVVVTFSEAVELPAQGAEGAFSIVDDGAGTILEITAAIMNFSDPSKKSVLLTTLPQTAGSTYIVTAGIQVMDASGNPIESGTSDTALFEGSSIEAAQPVDELDDAAGEETPDESTDTTIPELLNVTAGEGNTVLVEFSEKIMFDENVMTHFLITEEVESNNILNIMGAEVSEDGMAVTLTTAPQNDLSYFLIVLNIKDEAGNELDPENNATSFMGMVAAGEPVVDPMEDPVIDPTGDVMAPEDATDLVAQLLQSMVVQLSWKASLNTAGDLADYVLYRSNDGTTFGEGVVLSANALTHEIRGLVPGVEYFFKLTARDAAGNESDGVITGFMLPETGPELLLLFGGSLGAGRMLTRRKKKGLRNKATASKK